MDSDRHPTLGQFLRTRRALVRPEQVGLTTHGRRQVPGLRRDEVARLAGLSVGHYARLEQGHQRPTRQTVAGLGRALRLDECAMAELHRLARPVVNRRPGSRIERVTPHVLGLLNDWTAAPAYILGWSGDVLRRNALAAALHSHFVHGDNMLRMIFLDPAARDFFRDWTATARSAVHEVRQAARQTPNERNLRELVGELSIASPEFRRLWAERDPRRPVAPGNHFFHPHVGELHLRTEIFPITSTPGQRLIAQPAEPGSRSAETLALLSTLAA
jgi:transcriptional regulator with XRE-family HTH domain